MRSIEHLQGQPAQCRAGDDAAHDGQQERRRDVGGGEAPGCCSPDREPEDQKRGGIVQQAFAAENRQNPMGWPELAKHRRRGHGIRRCHDGAEREGRCPRHFRDQHTRDGRDRGRRQGDGDNDQAGDLAPVVFEVANGGVVRCVEQHGCDEQRQREFRRQCERGGCRHQGEQRATDREEDGVGSAGASCGGGQHHGGDKQQQDLFELPHGESSISAPLIPLNRSEFLAETRS